MGYRKSKSSCNVQITRLSLNKSRQSQCHRLQLEAGRCYSDMLDAHVQSRQAVWLTEAELKSHFKGYALYSQSVQAIAEKLIANVASAQSNIAREMEAFGKTDWRLPYKPKETYTVTWKEECFRWKEGLLHVSNGRGQDPLTLSLPAKYTDKPIKMGELVCRHGIYYLHMTIDTGEIDPPLLQGKRSAGLDLGEIHIASVSTDTGDTLIVSGRHLRSIKQKRNKNRKQIGQKIRNKQLCSRTKSQASKRLQKLELAQEQHRRKFERQQRDTLHKASRQIVEFCHDNKIATIYYGDIHGIPEKGKNSKQHNDRMSQWAHGQFISYLTYKARAYGISVKMIDESYSSKTCCKCGHVKKSSVTGRTYKCTQPDCGSIHHRDANGSCNIVSKGRHGDYGKVQPKNIKYLQPVWIKQGCSSPSEAGLSARTVTQL